MVKGTSNRRRRQHYKARHESRRNGGDTKELWTALQMVLMLENVELRPK
jgi:hypothetical protein